ncbi:hypothetical protein Patl1_33898 [Pistacia atlantica]|uniref:Uncharacterized protein n=1 Tax=Pistacia atlantica TaxID=434234 RepID=A0ACC0ZSZ6_9ROSI|nr:hypothetical protein Patl1_33898 [Pistacia atlantica]
MKIYRLKLISKIQGCDVNPDLHKKNKFIFPVVVAVVSTSVLSTAMAILWSLTRRKREDRWWLSLINIAGAALLVPLFCYLWFLIWRMCKAKVENKMNQDKPLHDDFGIGHNVSPPLTDRRGKTQDKDQYMKHELNIFNFETIATATDNFSTTNVLGKGGFGAVYKGILPDGQEIAVKRLSRSSNQGMEEFQNEANLIAKLQHTNLVRLLGCSLQAEERILVYEYMPNKSLDFFIFDSHRKKFLNWKNHFNIIEGIAQGLSYLHKYSRLRVIHRDLKASNILLDDQMNPKISDFGMARIFGMNESVANTNRIVGTYGYMSPEYAMNGIVSIKTDVYSFGVLVLEIVSGKKNTGCYPTEHPLNLVGYAWQLWNEGKGYELRDPTIDESCSPDEVLRCLHVGLLCVQNQAIDRPTMPEVVSMLTNEAILLPAPKQPAFFINDTTEQLEIPGEKVEDCSINTVTISVMEARS